jgi:hypothetical protein
MGLQYPTVSLLLPIWIAQHTDAPRWTVAAVAAVNSGVCVLLQTRIGSRIETPVQGGRALRTAGLLFLVSCPLMALAGHAPVWAAAGLAVAAVVVHSLGEIWESSGGFALGFGLAPDHAQGQYQGLLGLGFSAGQAVAPALLTTVVLGLGTAGWLLLGVFFAALGATGPARRTRAGGRVARRRRPARRPVSEGGDGARLPEAQCAGTVRSAPERSRSRSGVITGRTVSDPGGPSWSGRGLMPPRDHGPAAGSPDGACAGACAGGSARIPVTTTVTRQNATATSAHRKAR